MAPRSSLRQKLDAVDEGLGVVVPLAGARVVGRPCARTLGAEQAAVRPHYLEQQLQRLLVVEAGVVVEVLHVAVERLFPVRAAHPGPPAPYLVGDRAAAVAHDDLEPREVVEHRRPGERQDADALLRDEVVVERLAQVLAACRMDQRGYVLLLHLLVERIPVLLAHRRRGVLPLARVRIDHDADEPQVVDAAVDLLERVGHGRSVALRQARDAPEPVRLVLHRQRDRVVVRLAEPVHDLVRLLRVHQRIRAGRQESHVRPHVVQQLGVAFARSLPTGHGLRRDAWVPLAVEPAPIDEERLVLTHLRPRNQMLMRVDNHPRLLCGVVAALSSNRAPAQPAPERLQPRPFPPSHAAGPSPAHGSCAPLPQGEGRTDASPRPTPRSTLTLTLSPCRDLCITAAMRVSSFPHGRESRVRGQRTRWGPGLGMGLRKGLLVGRGDQTTALIPKRAHRAAGRGWYTMSSA